MAEDKNILPEQASKGENLQLIVFKLGGEEYAMVIDQIKEVVLTPRITKVPLTPSYIKGVANIRGTVLSIIDLVDRFGLGSNHFDTENNQYYSLIIESQEFRMGVLVKEVPSTLSVYESEIDTSPSLIGDTSIDSSYIRGIVKSGERMIVLIDVQKVINKEEIQKTIKDRSIA